MGRWRDAFVYVSVISLCMFGIHVCAFVYICVYISLPVSLLASVCTVVCVQTDPSPCKSSSLTHSASTYLHLYACMYALCISCNDESVSRLFQLLLGFTEVLFSADQQQLQLPPHGEWKPLTAVYWEQLAEGEQSIQLLHPVIRLRATPDTTFCLCQFPEGHFDMKFVFFFVDEGKPLPKIPVFFHINAH